MLKFIFGLLKLVGKGGEIAEVKAASTAALTTDPSVVVAISPNSIVPLPAGLATSANQVTANASLSSIDGKLPAQIADRVPVNIHPGDTNAVDGFGALRVASNFLIFNAKFVSDKQPLFWSETTAGAGAATINTNKALIEMVVGTASGDEVVRQTKRYFNSAFGTGYRFIISATMGAIKANVRQRICLGDASNGWRFEQDGTNLKIVQYGNDGTGTPASTEFLQSAWNIDPLDGTGISGVTIDTSKNQLWFFEYAGARTGRVRFGVMIGGVVLYCHQLSGANQTTTVFFNRISLPIRQEITNTGISASSTTMNQVAAAVVAESPTYHPTHSHMAASNGDTGVTANPSIGTIYPILSVRLKAAHIRKTMVPRSYSIMTTNANSIYYEIRLNASLTAPTFAVTTSANSIIEVDKAATAMTDGELILCGTLNQASGRSVTQEVESDLILAASIAGVSDILTIGFRTIGGGNSTMFASLEWGEEY